MRTKKIHIPGVVVSYKNVVTDESVKNMQEDETLEGEEVFDGLKIEERNIGEYECLEFILLEEEERRIAKPWKKCVIVKENQI